MAGLVPAMTTYFVLCDVEADIGLSSDDQRGDSEV
jgi:hypothetical protein